MFIPTDIEQNAAAYDRTSLYTFDNDIMLSWYAKRVVEVTKPGSSCLDLGLGHGVTSIMFSKHFGTYKIIEGSKNVMEQFGKDHPNHGIELIEGFFENFDTDERFDHIVMGFVLEHVDDADLIVSIYKKFLKPGGSIFVAVPNSHALNRRFGFVAGMLADLKEYSEYDIKLGHKRFYDVDMLREFMQKHNLEVVREEGIFMKVMTTQQMLDLKIPQSIIDAMCVVGIDYPELSVALLMEAKV